ncbi:DUF6498-containing protein [Mycolicibacterium austroafricanum]|uniref:DUF6498-containing protein n=1 Tax=Mycolicibacterium austroafricanum TaxID=39687 RepID=UPI000CF9C3A0|nr:DUF6498-containing protein [Mycolicibacterium austroafricanum]PQP40015.1 hypothetical protein C6A88_32120 [Mycolicibacterium austroafricanum]
MHAATEPSGVSRIAHVVTVLAVIAVPAVGWFVEGWSGATTLVVYWFETLAGALLIAVRIVLHRRWTPRRGHYRYEPPTTNRRSPTTASFLAGFLITTLVFTAAHGLFLAVILFLANHNGQQGLSEIDWRSIGYGCLLIVGLLCVDLIMDVAHLRRWSFWQIELTAQRAFSRVIVVHLTLIFGLFGLMATGASSALFGIFVALKTLAALSFTLPQWEPSRPPEWLSRVMNRVPSAQPEKRFEESWAEDRAGERARRERNEQPWVTRAR